MKLKDKMDLFVKTGDKCFKKEEFNEITAKFYLENCVIYGITENGSINTINDDEIFVGYAGIKDESHLMTFFIDPDYRRKNYASNLLYYLTENYSNIFLHVRINNIKAINIYTKYGFKKEEIIKGYYFDGEDAYVMRFRKYFFS